MRLLPVLKLSICPLFLGFTSHNRYPFPGIERANLPTLLIGDWEYNYSFNADSVYYNGGFEPYTPSRIEFRNSTKKEVKKQGKFCPELYKKRQETSLRNLSMFMNWKGRLGYGFLDSDSTGFSSFNEGCNLKFFYGCIDPEPTTFTVNSISESILIISNFGGVMEGVYHVYGREFDREEIINILDGERLE